MRGIVAVLLLLATVEGNPFWKGLFRPFGHSILSHGQSVLPPGNPFQQNWYPTLQQSGVDFSNAEWVCTNPKTRNMIVIAAVDGSQTVINGQTLPSGGCLNQSGCSNINTNPPNTNFGNQKPNTGNPETAAPVTYAPTTDKTTPTEVGIGIIDMRAATE